MKKLLSILAASVLTTSAASTIVSCGSKRTDVVTKPDINIKDQTKVTNITNELSIDEEGTVTNKFIFKIVSSYLNQDTLSKAVIAEHDVVGITNETLNWGEFFTLEFNKSKNQYELSIKKGGEKTIPRNESERFSLSILIPNTKGITGEKQDLIKDVTFSLKNNYKEDVQPEPDPIDPNDEQTLVNNDASEKIKLTTSGNGITINQEMKANNDLTINVDGLDDNLTISDFELVSDQLSKINVKSSSFFKLTKLSDSSYKVELTEDGINYAINKKITTIPNLALNLNIKGKNNDKDYSISKTVNFNFENDYVEPIPPTPPTQDEINEQASKDLTLNQQSDASMIIDKEGHVDHSFDISVVGEGYTIDKIQINENSIGNEYFNITKGEDGNGNANIIFDTEKIEELTKKKVLNVPNLIFDLSITGWNDNGEFSISKFAKLNFKNNYEIPEPPVPPTEDEINDIAVKNIEIIQGKENSLTIDTDGKASNDISFDVSIPDNSELKFSDIKISNSEDTDSSTLMYGNLFEIKKVSAAYGLLNYKIVFKGTQAQLEAIGKLDVKVLKLSTTISYTYREDGKIRSFDTTSLEFSFKSDYVVKVPPTEDEINAKANENISLKQDTDTITIDKKGISSNPINVDLTYDNTKFKDLKTIIPTVTHQDDKVSDDTLRYGKYFSLELVKEQWVLTFNLAYKEEMTKKLNGLHFTLNITGTSIEDSKNFNIYKDVRFNLVNNYEKEPIISDEEINTNANKNISLDTKTQQLINIDKDKNPNGKVESTLKNDNNDFEVGTITITGIKNSSDDTVRFGQYFMLTYKDGNITVELNPERLQSFEELLLDSGLTKISNLNLSIQISGQYKKSRSFSVYKNIQFNFTNDYKKPVDLTTDQIQTKLNDSVALASDKENMIIDKEGKITGINIAASLKATKIISVEEIKVGTVALATDAQASNDTNRFSKYFSFKNGTLVLNNRNDYSLLGDLDKPLEFSFNIAVTYNGGIKGNVIKTVKFNIENNYVEPDHHEDIKTIFGDVTDLGKIKGLYEDLGDQEALNLFQVQFFMNEKYKPLLGEVSFKLDKSKKTVTITANDNSAKYKGNIELTYQYDAIIPEKPDLMPANGDLNIGDLSTNSLDFNEMTIDDKKEVIMKSLKNAYQLEKGQEIIDKYFKYLSVTDTDITSETKDINVEIKTDDASMNGKFKAHFTIAKANINDVKKLSALFDDFNLGTLYPTDTEAYVYDQLYKYGETKIDNFKANYILYGVDIVTGKVSIQATENNVNVGTESTMILDINSEKTDISTILGDELEGETFGYNVWTLQVRELIMERIHGNLMDHDRFSEISKYVSIFNEYNMGNFDPLSKDAWGLKILPVNLGVGYFKGEVNIKYSNNGGFISTLITDNAVYGVYTLPNRTSTTMMETPIYLSNKDDIGNLFINHLLNSDPNNLLVKHLVAKQIMAEDNDYTSVKTQYVKVTVDSSFSLTVYGLTDVASVTMKYKLAPLNLSTYFRRGFDYYSTDLLANTKEEVLKRFMVPYMDWKHKFRESLIIDDGVKEGNITTYTIKTDGKDENLTGEVKIRVIDVNGGTGMSRELTESANKHEVSYTYEINRRNYR